MSFNDCTPMLPYLTAVLWAVNVLVYGGVVWLYLRPVPDHEWTGCAVCGSDTDALCVGLQSAAAAAAAQRRRGAAVYSLTAGRAG